jgi:hypothetical protein
MKTAKYIQAKFYLPLVLVVMTIVSCERDLSDDIVLATFPTTAEVFTDAPVGLTDEFFISFDPAGGANTEGFGTDDNVSFEGTSSIRIDVPSPNDPNGGFIGGIFRDRGEGRDLSGYDALTFWVKGSTTASVALFGFGTDFITDTHPVSLENVELSTDWRKVIIPIPDGSKLTQEKGMFIFSAGGFDINNTPTDFSDDIGYTFWIDEIKFERLGTLSLQQFFIENGNDVALDVFTGVNQRVTGLGATYNLPSGINQSITIAPSYFDFQSNNPSVTGTFQLNNGEVFTPITGVGQAVITAELAGILADGSITVNSLGDFPHAPIPPTRDPANVISLFSDAYTNVPVRHYNGFFAPFQTTLGGAGSDPNNVDIQAPFVGGGLDNIINYTALNFVSIGTYEAVTNVDASQMTHIHIDINVREAIDGSDFIRLSLENGTFVGSPVSGNFTLNSAALTSMDWVSLDIPLSSFAGLSDFSQIGQLFFISDASISDIWVDNVYFYRN